MGIFRTSLRNKLIGVFLAPTLLIVLLYGFVAHFASREGLEEELGKRLVSVGQTLSADLSDGIESAQIERLDADKHRVIDRLRDTLRQVKQRTGVRRVFLFDAQLDSLVDTREDVAFGQRLYEAEADRLELGRLFDTAKSATSTLFVDDQGAYYKTGYVPITRDGRVVAAVGVAGSAQYFDLLRDFTSVLTLLGAAGLLLVVVAGALFSRALVRPVNRLVAAARRVGDGDFETPIDGADDARQGDEIDFLAGSFEEMRRDILRRDRQMQMMLSGIAHEVRNPLGGMELFCGLLREDLEADPESADNEQKLAKLDKIRRELIYLDKVVQDFLDFARQNPLDLEYVDAEEFVADIRELLAGEVVEAGCTLQVEVTDGLGLTADPQKLRRAVINLVRNAYQACGDGGTIAVKLDAPAADRREIAVIDDGPGVSPDGLEEMFTPFFTTREKGSGLGLALTKQIIVQHGGRVDIDSQAGQGMTVRLTLPFDLAVDPVGRDVPAGWLG